MGEAKKLKNERRIAPREKMDPIEISGFTSLDHMTLLTRSGQIVDASKTGFLLQIDRKALVPKQFRDALSLQELEGDQVILMINPLNLELGGRIARTKRINKEVFEVVIDFSSDAPEYWRECLFELLPRKTDFD